MYIIKSKFETIAGLFESENPFVFMSHPSPLKVSLWVHEAGNRGFKERQPFTHRLDWRRLAEDRTGVTVDNEFSKEQVVLTLQRVVAGNQNRPCIYEDFSTQQEGWSQQIKKRLKVEPHLAFLG